MLQQLETMDEFLSFEEQGPLDLTSVLNAVDDGISDMAEDEVFHLVLLYARSSCVPRLCSDSELQKRIACSSRAIIDVIYLHDKASEENCVQEVYGALETLHPTMAIADNEDVLLVDANDTANDACKAIANSKHGFILESSKRNFRSICILLSRFLCNPAQRLNQAEHFSRSRNI